MLCVSLQIPRCEEAVMVHDWEPVRNETLWFPGSLVIQIISCVTWGDLECLTTYYRTLNQGCSRWRGVVLNQCVSNWCRNIFVCHHEVETDYAGVMPEYYILLMACKIIFHLILRYVSFVPLPENKFRGYITYFCLVFDWMWACDTDFWTIWNILDSDSFSQNISACSVVKLKLTI